MKQTKTVSKFRLVKSKTAGLVSALTLLSVAGVGVSADEITTLAPKADGEAVVTSTTAVEGSVAEVEATVETDFVEVKVGVLEAPAESSYEPTSEALNAGDKFTETDHPVALEAHEAPVDEDFIPETGKAEAGKTEETNEKPVREDATLVFDKDVKDLEVGSEAIIDNGVTVLKADRPATTNIGVVITHDKDSIIDKERSELEAKALGFNVEFEEGRTVYTATKELVDKANTTVNVPQDAKGNFKFEALVSLHREMVEKEEVVPHTEYDPVVKTRDVMELITENGVERLVKTTKEYTEYVPRQADYTVKKYEEKVNEYFENLTISVLTSNEEGTLDKLAIVAPSGTVTEVKVVDGKAEFMPIERGTHRVDYAVSSTGAKAVDFTLSIQGVSTSGEAVSGKVVGTTTVTRKVIEPYEVTKTREVIDTITETEMVGRAEEYDGFVEKVRLEERDETYTEPVKKTRKVTKVELQPGKETRTRVVEVEEDVVTPVEKTRMVPGKVPGKTTVTKTRLVEKQVPYEDTETVTTTGTAAGTPAVLYAANTQLGLSGSYYSKTLAVVREISTLKDAFPQSFKGIYHNTDEIVTEFENAGFEFVRESSPEQYTGKIEAWLRSVPPNLTPVVVLDSSFPNGVSNLNALAQSFPNAKFIVYDGAEGNPPSGSNVIIKGNSETRSAGQIRDAVTESITTTTTNTVTKYRTEMVEETYEEEVDGMVDGMVEEKYTENVTTKVKRQVSEEYEVDVMNPVEVEVDEEYIELETRTRKVTVPVTYNEPARLTRLVQEPKQVTKQVKRTESYKETNYRLVDKQFTVDARNVSEATVVSLAQSQKFEELRIVNPDLYVSSLSKAGKDYGFKTEVTVTGTDGFSFGVEKVVTLSTKPEEKPAPAKVEEVQPQVAPVAILPAESGSAKLPETGDGSALLSILGGVSLLGVAGGLKRRRKG